MPQSPDVSIGAFLARQAAVDPAAPYLFFDDEVISFGRLDETVSRAARALHDLGIRFGDRVAVLMRNRPEFLYAWLGAVRLGAVYVPVIADNTPGEVDYVLQHSGAVALITTPDLLEPLGDVRARCPALRHVLVAGDELDALIAASEPVVPGRAPAAGDLAQIAYTSGSTARPKGVMQTHYAYVRTGIEMARALEYTPEDRQFVVLPLFHGGAVNTQILPSLAARSTAVLLPRFSASRFWSQVKRYDPTQLGLMHGMQSMLLTRDEVPEEKGHRIRFSWGTATEPIERAFRERFGIPSLTTYGLSECSFVTTARPGQPYRAGWCGTPGMDDMEVRILDPVTLQDVPLEATGIITVRNPCVMLGYYEQPEETARALRDGWLITGDLGALDAGGNLYFRGKHKHVIRRSGENISGEEVEATVLEHPGVVACTASAVPDPVREEEVKVVVAVHPGATVTEEEIRAWVGARLAKFKVPRYVELVS